MLLFVLVGIWLFLFYFKEWYERTVNKKPPGPWPLPFLGCVLQLGAAAPEPHLAFVEFSKRYGEIFRLKVGPSKELVILSTVEGIREVFADDASGGREINDGTLVERQMHGNFGIIMSEGPHWEFLRGWTMRQLRDSGFGKSAGMDHFVKDELRDFLDHLETLEDEKGVVEFNPYLQFEKHVLKMFWRMLVGDLIGMEEQEMMHKLLEKSEHMIANGTFGAGILAVFPWLKHVMPEYTGYNLIKGFYDFGQNTARDLLKDRLKELKESSTYRDTGGLLDAFAAKMIKNDQPEHFTENDWIVLFLDVLQASTDTTSSFMEAILLFMVLNPDVQQKVYEEMQQVVPEGEEFYYGYLKKMPYLQAVYLEVHRHAKILQHLVPRKMLSDLKYKDHVIKKGTQILADFYTAYSDPILWPEPDAFKPERFIDSKGSIINEDKVLPFGIGKRMCPGNNFGNTVSFLLFTGILRKYELTCVPGKARPSTTQRVAFTSRPQPFQMLFKKR